MSSLIDSCARTLASNPAGAVLCDAGGHIRWANPAAASVLGRDNLSLIGQDLSCLMPGPASMVSPGTCRHRFIDPEGERRWIHRTASTLRADDGEQWELHLLGDLAEFDGRQRLRSAVVAGLHDERLDLDTGVLNRDAILREAAAQISRNRRYGNPLSLIALRYSDCDGLAQGEVRSSSTRETVAQCINEALRWVDSVGVLAPGEFLVVLPETGGQAADTVARKLESLCARTHLPAPRAELRCVTASVEWVNGLDMNAALTELSNRISMGLETRAATA